MEWSKRELILYTFNSHSSCDIHSGGWEAGKDGPQPSGLAEDDSQGF
jgi:hypothetical protein